MIEPPLQIAGNYTRGICRGGSITSHPYKQKHRGRLVSEPPLQIRLICRSGSYHQPPLLFHLQGRLVSGLPSTSLQERLHHQPLLKKICSVTVNRFLRSACGGGQRETTTVAPGEGVECSNDTHATRRVPAPTLLLPRRWPASKRTLCRAGFNSTAFILGVP